MTDPAAGPTIIEVDDLPPAAPSPLGPAVVQTDDRRPIAVREQPPVATAVTLPRSRRWRPAKIAFIGVSVTIAGLLLLNAFEWIRTEFDRGPAIGGLASAILAAGVLGLGYWLMAELLALAALKSVEKIQMTIAKPDPGFGLIEAIIGSLPSEPAVIATLAIYRHQLQPHHDLHQRLDLLSRTVLAPIDRRAEAVIRASILQSMAIMAVAPNALLESLLFLARGTRLIRQIAELYGCRPGLTGTLHLVRRVAFGATVVGTVDVIGNIVTQRLGGAVLEKISTDIAESLYASQRMARLGILSMNACRPIPFDRDAIPSLTKLATEIFRR